MAVAALAGLWCGHALLAQASPVADTSPRPATPVLAFPEQGMDDPAAYQGYQTRFYRDSKGNTVQIYLERRTGRVVHLWADAADESIGFTARDERGRPAALAWGAGATLVADSGTTRTIEYRLTAHPSPLVLGWFLLGSMRVERDFQYAGQHRRPFGAPAFTVAEESELVTNIAALPPGERARHLVLLRADDVAALRARLRPTIAVSQSQQVSTVRVERRSLDGRTRLALELRVDPRDALVQVNGETVTLRPRAGRPVRLALRLVTNAAALTPLGRDAIFSGPFLDFLARARATHDGAAQAMGSAPHSADSTAPMRYRRLEREVRSVELLSSQEKLMAGLPNFATYFGRDMLMTALMMQSIWTPAMSEHVIASVLRKLGPAGDVSHEEALGEQAIRENAAEYNTLIAEYRRALAAREHGRADSLLSRARERLGDLQATRENYHMLDDEFQLPVLAARYLADPAIPANRKHAFLRMGSASGTSRLALLLRELALVAAETRAYARDPLATNLVAFERRDATHWRSSSWRDSDAGYGGGRFAMDINAIWVPHALEAIAEIAAALPGIGIGAAELDSVMPDIAGSPLREYLADPDVLRRAIETWKGARRHFVVMVEPREITAHVRDKLASLPAAEAQWWKRAIANYGEVRGALAFLAVSLDAAGRPIPIVNTDPATGFFLESGETGRAAMLGALPTFLRPYPIGLFVDGLGPVVANDTYAPRSVWERFRQDPYHSPRVVWGREVNLLLLGLTRQLIAGPDTSGPAADSSTAALHEALRRVRGAVNASGLEHSEL